jgi:hypothetical protein
MALASFAGAILGGGEVQVLTSGALRPHGPDAEVPWAAERGCDAAACDGGHARCAASRAALGAGAPAGGREAAAAGGPVGDLGCGGGGGPATAGGVSLLRDFTYVGDVVAAVAAALDADRGALERAAAAGRGGGGPAGAGAGDDGGEPRRGVHAVLNVGAGRPAHVGRLLRLLEGHLGKRAARVEARPLRPGDPDVPATWADVRAAAQALGWRPRVGFEEGLRRTVDWMREDGMPGLG